MDMATSVQVWFYFVFFIVIDNTSALSWFR